MSELCIMVAPNGARRTPEDHPALPITPGALARTATACRRAGASAMHLHVRDIEGRHTLDAGAYRNAIEAIREACPELVIQTTTEAAGVFDLSTQISSVEALRPARLSFGLAELLCEGERRARSFLAWAAEHAIAIQFILYDAEQIRDFARLHRRKRLHLSTVSRLLLVAGRYSTTQDSDVAEFDALHAALQWEGLDQEAIWMACAFGRGEIACLERCIARGGHVRVGFENAITDAEGHPARDNAERVAIVAGLAARYGRPLATPEQARKVLGGTHSRPLLETG